MAEAAGWGIIPVTISMAGATKQLNKQLVGPAKKAGKDAGDGIEKGVSKSASSAAKAVDKASEQQVRARDRAADAADKTKLAELKLSEVLDKSNAKASEIATATGRLEKARRDQQRADQNAAKATDNLEDAQKRLDKAQEASKGSGLEVSASMKDIKESAGDAGGSLDILVGKLGGIAGAAAGIGSIGAAIAEGFDMTQAVDKMNRQLGLTGDAAEQAGAEVGQALRTGTAGGVDEAVGAIGSLTAQFDDLGVNGSQTAGDLADNFLAFTDTFGVSMEEATQTAGQLLQNGLAPDVESAADLMTSAFQRVPAAMREELPDIINEYGQNFKNLGFSGEEAFGLLVSAADKGKWALDKTGDALKEFTIRGSDMSASSVEAYEKIGLSAEEMSAKIVQGGPGAQEALKQVADGILAIDDPAEQSNTAIQLFGTQMEDLGVDQVPAFMQALSEGSGGLQDFQGSSQELADQMTNSLQGRMNALKGTVQDLAGAGFMKLWDALEPIVSWAQNNSAWLTPIAVGVGVFAGALAAAGVAAGIWAGAQALLNTALLGSPITWIVGAIAGLVAALVWVFTKTEWGQKVWEGFIDVLKGVWSWISGTFGPVFSWLGDVIGTVWQGILDGWNVLWQGIQNAWNNVLKPVFDTLWTVVSTTLGVIGTLILAPLLVAWNLLSAGISAAWENLIKPAWNNLVTVAQWMWTTILQPIFSYIQFGWQNLTTAIQFAWQNILKPVWDAVALAAQWLWNTILSPVFGWIKAGWQALGDGIRWVYDTIIKPAWDAVGNALRALWDGVVSPVVGWIQGRWDQMGSGIRAVYDNVINPAFEALKGALQRVKDFFGTIVDGIRSVWDGLRSALAKPINFMINTVYNDGILKAWNTVAKFIPGLNEASPLAGIPEHANGGAIRGPGDGTSDDVLMWGSNGEHMLTAAEVDALGGQGAVYAMRRLIDQGKTFTVGDGGLFVSGDSKNDNGAMIPVLGAFKDGGDINDKKPAWEAKVEAGHQWAQSVNGRPYLTGSQWDNGGDCSGYMSAIASVILGAEPNAGHWATTAFPASQGDNVPAGNQTWEKGLSQGFSIGITGGPASGGQNGHTAGTLSAAGSFSSVNVESGGSHGNVAYGGPAAGADDGQWASGNYHLPIGADGDFESAGGPSPAEKKGYLRDKVKEIFDKILSPIDGMFSSAIGDPPPELLGVPPKAMHESSDRVVDFLFDRIEDLGNLLGKAYDGAKKLGETVVDAGKSVAHFMTGGLLFDTGGMLASGGVAVNQSGRPERILDPDQTETFEQLLAVLPGLMDGSVGVDADAVLREAAETFGAAHPDVASEIAAGVGDSVQDFFGVKGSWMVDPSALEITTETEQATPEVTPTADVVEVADDEPAPVAPVDDTQYSSLYQSLDDIAPDRHKVPESGMEAYVYGIVQAAQDHSLPAAGARIGVATALVESGDPMKMYASNAVPESLNYPHDAIGSDHDSIGLFQQRQAGWGTVAQRMDPHDSASMFFDAMLRKFPNWQSMDPGAVAQGVQVSAFPDRYNTKMGRAEELVASAGLYDQGGILPHGALAVNLSGSPEHVFTDNAMSDFVDATERMANAADTLVDAGKLNIAKPVEVKVQADRTTADDAPISQGDGGAGKGTVVNLVMENVNTVDTQKMSRDVMREARRVLAAFA